MKALKLKLDITVKLDEGQMSFIENAIKMELMPELQKEFEKEGIYKESNPP